VPTYERLEDQRSIREGKMMMRIFTKLTVTGFVGLFILLVALPSLAAPSADDMGEDLVKCFHSGDRHMDTTMDVLVSKSELAALAEACNGTVLKVANLESSYRGGWTNSLYRMRTEMSAKFTCVRNRDGSTTQRLWIKFLNTRDSKTPEPCEKESWKLSETKEIKAPKPSKAMCEAECYDCMAAPEVRPDDHFMCGLVFNGCCVKAGGSVGTATCQCN
jgi:hypothetical protein